MNGFETARDEILEWVAQAVDTPLEALDLTIPLADLGLDSLDSVHMIATIESIIRMELPEDVIQRVGCLNDILDMMRDKMAAA